MGKDWDDYDVDSLERHRHQVVEFDHVEVGFPGLDQNEKMLNTANVIGHKFYLLLGLDGGKKEKLAAFNICYVGCFVLAFFVTKV